MAWASVSGVVGSCCESVQGLLIEGHRPPDRHARWKACCPACRKYGTACGGQPAPHEMHRQGCRHLPCTLPKAVRQSRPNTGMPPGLTPGRNPLIQDFLIQGMDESYNKLSPCHRAIPPGRGPGEIAPGGPTPCTALPRPPRRAQGPPPPPRLRTRPRPHSRLRAASGPRH